MCTRHRVYFPECGHTSKTWYYCESSLKYRSHDWYGRNLELGDPDVEFEMEGIIYHPCRAARKKYRKVLWEYCGPCWDCVNLAYMNTHFLDTRSLPASMVRAIMPLREGEEEEEEYDEEEDTDSEEVEYDSEEEQEDEEMPWAARLQDLVAGWVHFVMIQAGIV